MLWYGRGLGRCAVASSPVLVIVLLLAGCGTGFKARNNGSRATSSPTQEVGAPVDFRFLGLTEDRTHMHYTISVNTSRPIAEVDIAVWEDDMPAPVGTYVWKNVVGFLRQPIEAGKTYDALDIIYPNARLTDAVLQAVLFKDGGIWRPPK